MTSWWLISTDGGTGRTVERQYVYLVSWTAEECEAIRTVTLSDHDDSNHRIPEDIEGQLARRWSCGKDHDDGDGEREMKIDGAPLW